MPTYFIDETGFTGEDLLESEQPIFVQATNNFTDEESKRIVSDIFCGVNSDELKYSRLARNAKHRNRIASLVKFLASEPNRSGTWIAHKEFALLTLVVDWWMEPLAYRSGINLYENGGNIAMSNMLFNCLGGFWSNLFRRKLLLHFQKMFRSRTVERYDECRNFIEYEMVKVRHNSSMHETLNYFNQSFYFLGHEHVTTLPQRVLDLALPGLVLIGHKWRERGMSPALVVHDQSSNMAKQKWLWDAVSSPDVETAEFHSPGGVAQFPMNVSSTQFADSRETVQLQICDLLAGATSEFLRADRDDPYRQELEAAGILELAIGTIWPSMDVTPEALGTKGWDGAKAVD